MNSIASLVSVMRCLFVQKNNIVGKGLIMMDGPFLFGGKGEDFILHPV